jgi:hypothetical protein
MSCPALFSARVSPTLGTPTIFTGHDTTDRDSTIISHNSATGNVLVRLFARRNSSSSAIAATWGDGSVVPITQRAKATGATATSAIAWIGLCTGGMIGLGNVTIVNASQRCIAVWVQDVINLSGSPIGEVGETGEDTSDTTVDATVEISNTRSLVTAVGGFVSGSADPFTVSGAWTKSENQSGTGSNDVAAVFAQLSPSAIGDAPLTPSAPWPSSSCCRSRSDP